MITTITRSDESKVQWLWYHFDGDPLYLDRSHYPILRRKDGNYCVPDWACVMPSSGIHERDDFRPINALVESLPPPKTDISAISGINLVRMDWFATFIEELDINQFYLGNVIFNGEVISRWRTLTTRSKPRMRAERETIVKPCPVCGHDLSILVSGNVWLDIRDKVSDKIFSTKKGIFLRKDIVEKCNVPFPEGVTKEKEYLMFDRHC